MILAATTQSLEIVLGGAVTTNQLRVCVEYTDIIDSAYTPGHQDALTNGTTVVTILSAPGASTYRACKHINIQQNDTVAATVTIRFNNNSTIRELIAITLQPGQTLTWSSEAGWRVASYQAASDTVPGIIEIATQDEMETGTDVTRAVTPGRMQYHPAVSKAWGMANGAGTSLVVSYNISSITDTATGRLGVNINVDMSSANYGIQLTLQRSVTALTATGVEDNNIRNASQAAGSFECESYDHTATTMAAQDPAYYYFVCHGDQA